MTDTRTQLKARFAAGQRIGESDFSALVDSLAHLSEDLSSGSLASGDSVSQLSTALDDLKAFAESHKSEFDGYIGTHPTLEQVTDADTAVRDELNASITSSVQSLQDADQEILGFVNENSEISYLLLDVFTDSFYALDNDITGLYATHATKALVDLKVQELQSEIESRAYTEHTHDEYATKVSIGNFITAEDIPNFAAEIHQHTAAEITDLDGMFATDERVLELIEENRTTIDVNAIIADGYYTKGEVDQKFYVQTLDTTQITGFNNEVSSIATSIAQVELATAKSEIAADLNIDVIEGNVTQLQTDVSTLTTDLSETNQSIRTDFAAADSAILSQVSLGNTNITQAYEYADTLLTQAYQAADAQIKVSFAAADVSVLAEAKAYSDERVTDLIGGASEAYDTLKEIQDAVENGGGATADVINNLTLVNQEIDANDAELDDIRKWLGRTVFELELDPPTTVLSSDVTPGDTTIYVADETGFAVGDEIVIGAVGPSQEIATVSELGSLILESPLVNFHPTGTRVALRNPLISSIASISGGSASSSDLEALQETVSQLQNTVATLEANQVTLQTQLADQEVLIAELEEMIEEGAYSQNNYFARYYVTDGYAATFESGYYAEEGYTTVGYTSQYA